MSRRGMNDSGASFCALWRIKMAENIKKTKKIKEKWFLLVIHLDKTSKAQEILEIFSKNGLTGCTTFDTTGVGHTTFLKHDKPAIASMKYLFGPDKQYNKTIFTVIEGKKLLKKTMDDVEAVVEDFCKPDIGLMYALPVQDVRGYRVDLGDGNYECKI
jgi:nitrogen regulatory protein P-II 1